MMSVAEVEGYESTYSNYSEEGLVLTKKLHCLKVVYRRPVFYSSLCSVSPILPTVLIGCVIAFTTSDFVTQRGVTSTLLCSAGQPHLDSSHSLSSMKQCTHNAPFQGPLTLPTADRTHGLASL